MKLEESLRDHVEILQTLNAKLNNHMAQQSDFKLFINDRIDRVEKLSINKEIENIPGRFDMMQWEQTLKKIIADIEIIRNDQLSTKELDLQKTGETSIFFKKTANDYFSKLKELEADMKYCTIGTIMVCS